MSKPLLFYLIDERTDSSAYCKRKGMKPYKSEGRILDNEVYKSEIQFTYKGHIYDVLESDQCYTGYMITLMRLPKMAYVELLNVALDSKHYKERIGAMGIILKEYAKEFEQSLISMTDTGIEPIENKRHIKRMLVYVYHLINTSYNSELEYIRNICRELLYGISSIHIW